MVGTWDGNNNKGNVYLKYPNEAKFCKVFDNVAAVLNYKTNDVNVLYIGGEEYHWNAAGMRFAGTIDSELHMINHASHAETLRVSVTNHQSLPCGCTCIFADVHLFDRPLSEQEINDML